MGGDLLSDPSKDRQAPSGVRPSSSSGMGGDLLSDPSKDRQAPSGVRPSSSSGMGGDLLSDPSKDRQAPSGVRPSSSSGMGGDLLSDPSKDRQAPSGVRPSSSSGMGGDLLSDPSKDRQAPSGVRPSSSRGWVEICSPIPLRALSCATEGSSRPLACFYLDRNLRGGLQSSLMVRSYGGVRGMGAEKESFLRGGCKGSPARRCVRREASLRSRGEQGLRACGKETICALVRGETWLGSILDETVGGNESKGPSSPSI